MRLLFFSPQPLGASAEDRAFVSLAREARRVGHRASLLSVAAPGACAALPREVTETVQLPFLPPSMQSTAGAAAFDALDEEDLDRYLEAFERGLVRAAKRFDPQLVHVNYLWLGAAMARSILHDVPVVASCHSVDLENAGRCPQLLRRVIPPVRELQAVFTCTQGESRGAGSAYGIRSDRLQQLCRGVDTQRYRPPETTATASFASAVERWSLPLPVRPTLRVMVLADADDPELPLLINALRSTCEGAGGPIAVLCLDGDAMTSPSEEDGVFVIGASSEEVRAELLRGSHLVIPRGSAAEILGYTLEALACGCRVLLTCEKLTAWPTDEVLAKGVLRVAPEAAAISAAVSELLSRSREGRLDKTALYVASRMSWEAIFRSVERVYAAAL
ncbi:MAG: hypothetical protein CSA65_06650 [Proteobacteria bacterium]|nr:MAG: hypothetical protein CSB49_00370 [Pseudomonadota bacterium]PIE17960.1 MAG: hypothetical protein CSA65_06650 [Pseudomonadota bacterium]